MAARTPQRNQFKEQKQCTVCSCMLDVDTDLFRPLQNNNVKLAVFGERQYKVNITFSLQTLTQFISVSLWPTVAYFHIKRVGIIFYNYKNFHSIDGWAICDAKYCFGLVEVGSYGRENDAAILTESAFWKTLLLVTRNERDNKRTTQCCCYEVLNDGINDEYYGISFDRNGSQFCFHMIAVIADDRRE